MKYIYLIAIIISSSLNAQTEDNEKKWVVFSPTVEDDDKDLFEKADLFYDKFHEVSLENITYTSSKIIGVPDGKLASHMCLGDSLHGKPKLLWLSKIILDNKFRNCYLVCAIYPYSNKTVQTIETSSKNWIQGKRRFDLWVKQSDSSWKVKLDVDLSKPEKSLVEPDINLLVIRNQDPVQAVQAILLREAEISNALEKSIIHYFENNK